MNNARTCRSCGHTLSDDVLDLGAHPFSNAYVPPGEEALERRYPLHVWVCANCLLVQTDFNAPADAVFTESYAYFSSMSASWVRHAETYADAMTRRFGLGPSSLVVEVASNDGYLLQHFVRGGIRVLGVEPTRSTAEAAMARGVRTRMVFFGREEAGRIAREEGQADLMAANNVLAHVPDIRDFVAGFAALLKPEGVATFEFPHVLRLLESVQFDTIYHEHYSYLSLLALERIFAAAGLRIFDVEELGTHGGSLRLFTAHAGSAHRETANVARVRAAELAAGLDRPAGYAGLAPKVRRIAADFLAFLDDAAKAGRRVAAYGAAAKGNTFLNFCNVRAPSILMVADRAPSKQGLLLPGSHIPIVSPEKLLEARPDHVVILPWNLRDEIAGQLAGARAWGATFVTAIPDLRIF